MLMDSIFIHSHPCCIHTMDLLHLLVTWMSKNHKLHLFSHLRCRLANAGMLSHVNSFCAFTSDIYMSSYIYNLYKHFLVLF